MRAPTSPTAISICCCSLLSIVRCSGSVRSRGGTLTGWPNWPKSSATPGRSKSSRTGCPTPRFCSISCSTFGGRRPVWKWRGRARCAAAWSAFSRQPRPLRSWAGASGSGRRPSSCRLSSSLPARSPIAPRRCLRRPSTGGSCCDGRAQAAIRLLLFIGPRVDLHRLREGDELFGQVSGQRKLRLAAAGDGTYSYPAAAGPILWPSAVSGNRLARC